MSAALGLEHADVTGVRTTSQSDAEKPGGSECIWLTPNDYEIYVEFQMAKEVAGIETLVDTSLPDNIVGVVVATMDLCILGGSCILGQRGCTVCTCSWAEVELTINTTTGLVDAVVGVGFMKNTYDPSVTILNDPGFNENAMVRSRPIFG